jgi:phenylacetate-coenzyme A ligase PaaK-like adenylate-forming protein
MSALRMALEAAPRYAFLLRSRYCKADRLRAYTEHQLARTLKAAARIPFYADRLGGSPKPDDFARLPILERTDVAVLNASVRSMYPPDRRFLWGASSGLTGIEAEFLFDRARVRGRYAARIRYLRAHGWNPLRRTIFHQVNHPPDSDWVKHRIWPGLMAVSTDLAGQFRRIVEIDPVYLYMFPSNLEGMLQFLEDTNRKLPSLRLVFTVAETVDDALRQRARHTLGVEIADNYGATEGFIAWQCPQGSYHINAEHVLVELVDETGRQVAPGEMGRVVITTLENFLMPLVRYDLSDYAIAAAGTCRCGRTLPLLGGIVGRKRAMFRRADGRIYFPYVLTDALRLTPAIKQYQLVQVAAEAFRVLYVADAALDSAIQSRIREEFQTILGTPVTIAFDRVAEFARTPSGKFLQAISELAIQNKT